MGDLMDELVPPARVGGRCPIAVLMEGGVPRGSTGDALGETDRASLVELIGRADVSATRLSRTLRERRGLAVSDDAIQRHRRGACACP